MDKQVLGVLASGRGSNLAAIMDSIDAGELPAVIGVVISDNPGAYALERAQAAGIATCVIERKYFSCKEEFEAAINAKLKEHGVGLVVLAGYMRLLGKTFVSAWPLRVMNIHPALLPSFPGLDAQGQAIRYGAKVSGCTVHFVDEGMDTGPIILQKAVDVSDDDTEESLAGKILKEEHLIYKQAIKLWLEGRLAVEGRRVRIKK